MGTLPLCFGRKKSPSRPTSPSGRIAPAPNGRAAKNTEESAVSTTKRATSPPRRAWQEHEGYFRTHKKAGVDSVNGRTTGSVKARTRDSKGNAVLLSVASQVLKKYEVKALIGSGSFSQVLRIVDISTMEPFALKVIEKQPVEGNRYAVELNILKRVNHPNVISLHEVFQSSRKVYLVLELALGGDLFDRIYSKGFYSEDCGKRLVSMVLSGVAYLHKLGITHRDLKLENILFRQASEDSEIVISDFGLAHFKSEAMHGDVMSTVDRDVMSTMCGSAEYLAPEMLRGEEYTSLVDMWALGVITYVVLSRRKPFVDESRAKLYQKIANGHFSFNEEPWTSVSLTGKDFISKLLCVDCAHRLSAQEALEHNWFTTM